MSTEVTPELILAKLREALAELRRPISPRTGNGWSKGGLGLGDTCKCLDGALFWVARQSHQRPRYELLDALRRRVAEVIADITGVGPPELTAPFIWRWNDVLWPLLVTSNRDLFTVTQGLAMAGRSQGIYTGVALATAVMAILPVVVAYLFLQRYVIRSVVSSGVKG